MSRLAYQQRQVNPSTVTSTVLGSDRRMDGNSSLRRSMETPHYTAQGRRNSIAAASRTDEKAEQTSPALRSSNYRVSEQTSPQIYRHSDTCTRIKKSIPSLIFLPSAERRGSLRKKRFIAFRRSKWISVWLRVWNQPSCLPISSCHDTGAAGLGSAIQQ